MAQYRLLRHSPDVVFRELDGEAVLLDFNTGRYFGLNTVGTRVWTLLASGASVADVTRAIEGEFEASANDVARDVDELVSQLVSRGLLVAESGPDAGS